MDWRNSIVKGLRGLQESSFPKKCSTCGVVFNNVTEYIAGTTGVNEQSGLVESVDDDQKTIIEVFRNCNCGSTLMEFCADRRDTSPQGIKRRKIFSELMKELKDTELSEEQAREELKKVIYGKGSHIIECILKKTSKI